MKVKILSTLHPLSPIFLLTTLLVFTAPLFASNQIHLSPSETQKLAQGELILREPVNSEERSKTVEVIGQFDAPLTDIVQIITDYEQYSNFMPNIDKVEIVNQDSLESILNFTLTLPLGIVKKYRIVISLTKIESHTSTIAWHSLPWPELHPSETIGETQGYWVIQEDSDTSSIVLYHVFTNPGPIPWGLGWIVDLLTKKSAPEVLLQTRAQAENYTLTKREPLIPPKRVLFVVTSHNQLGTTGEQTGYYFSEVTHPYFQIVDAGFEVDIASPQGGLAPMDPRSLKLKDSTNLRFYQNPAHMSKLEQTLLLKNLFSSDYSAILFVGGHGSMWDFPGNKTIGALTASIYENGGITAAVCHGPAALVNIKLSDNSYLVAGKMLTSFTNEEEVVKNLTDEMPFLLESKLIERGALFTKAGVWQEKVVVSDRLITGQNPASAEAVGQAIVQLLQSQK